MAVRPMPPQGVERAGAPTGPMPAAPMPGPGAGAPPMAPPPEAAEPTAASPQAPATPPPMVALSELAGQAQNPEQLQQYLGQLDGPNVLALIRDLTEYVIPQLHSRLGSAVGQNPAAGAPAQGGMQPPPPAAPMQ